MTYIHKPRFNLRNIKAAQFHDDESGAILPLAIVMFLLMVLASGMAIDFMRHEMARADLQNALDRGVLAAADMSQTLTENEDDAKALIEEYMASRSYLAPNLIVDVNMPEIPGGRMIEASANYTLDTFFLDQMGINTIKIPAVSRAQQAASRLEISLILDVSDSMTADSTWTRGTRLTDLQDAAKDFVDSVLTDENKARTAISIIPYSAQVNMSAAMAAQMNINRHHNYGNCVDFSANDYETTGISTTELLDQSQHFFDYWDSYWYKHYYTTYEWVRTRWGWRQEAVRTYEWRQETVGDNYLCPRSANQILPFSNNKTALNNAIESLTPEGWTAAYTGMKWGAALVDPAARPMINGLVGQGLVSEDFRDLPASFDDMGTRKIIVLMTDGRNTKQYKVKNNVYASYTPAWFHENTVPDGGLETRVDNDSDGLGDDYLEDICTAAKGHRNVLVYTIGFELHSSPDAAEVLKNCASSLSTHYMVEGVNIDLAFANIAAQIENLKLTQ